MCRYRNLRPLARGGFSSTGSTGRPTRNCLMMTGGAEGAEALTVCRIKYVRTYDFYVRTQTHVSIEL